MERKKRYCTQCGSKTNDTTCEICSRNTRLITDRFKETYLNLVSDDIETFDHIEAEQKNRKRVYSNDLEETHENLDHVEQNVMFRGRRRRTTTNYDENDRIAKVRKVLVIVAFVMLVAVIKFIFSYGR